MPFNVDWPVCLSRRGLISFAGSRLPPHAPYQANGMEWFLFYHNRFLFYPSSRPVRPTAWSGGSAWWRGRPRLTRPE